MLRKIWLLLLLILVSCAHGPRVRHCLIDAESPPGAQCSDGLTHSFLSLQGYACMKPFEIGMLLRSCRHYGPHVNYCTFGQNGLYCADGSFLSFQQAVNYDCLSPEDIGALLRYCNL